MEQGYILCYHYNDIAYPVVYTVLKKAQDKQREMEEQEQKKIVIRIVSID